MGLKNPKISAKQEKKFGKTFEMIGLFCNILNRSQ
jgi:hypothetical protein